MEKIQLAAYLPNSRVNGPGLRAVLWVQGCPFRCPGCFNPEFQPWHGGQSIAVAEIRAWIDSETAIEGITISGGEPFSQARPLAELAEQIQRAGKGVLIFTGFSKAALCKNSDPDVQRFLAASDLLVAGPYQSDKPFRHSLLASANQELIFLTDRYQNINFSRRRIEFQINRHGTTTITGFPDRFLCPSVMT